MINENPNGLQKSCCQMDRICWLHHQLRLESFPSARVLADHFGISLSTAYRDIDYLKFILKAPIQYDRKQKGFYYTSSEFQIPEVKLLEGEFVCVLALEQLARTYRDTPFFELLRRGFEKIAASFRDSVNVDWDSLSKVLSFDIDPLPKDSIVDFLTVLRSIREKKSVRLIYFSGQKGQSLIKEVDPYRLLFYRGHWFLVGKCHEKMEIRDFMMSRVLSAVRLDAAFEVDPDFDLERHTNESLLLGKDAVPTTVKVKFDNFASQWIRNKQWHPSQQVQEQSDGSLILTITVSSLDNIVRWALSFGEHCRVLEPRELVERMRTVVHRMGRLYFDRLKKKGKRAFKRDDSFPENGEHQTYAPDKRPKEAKV